MARFITKKSTNLENGENLYEITYRIQSAHKRNAGIFKTKLVAAPNAIDARLHFYDYAGKKMANLRFVDIVENPKVCRGSGVNQEEARNWYAKNVGVKTNIKCSS